MAIDLTVANNIYSYPEPGEDPGWAEGATDWAKAVTDVLNTLLAPSDILETSYIINNNIAVATDVNRLFFDPGVVRAANITYSIYRASSTNTAGKTESGVIYINFDNAAAPGSKWTIGQQTIGNAGVSFTITDAGQLQYTSTDIGSVSYQGSIKFLAKTLSQ